MMMTTTCMLWGTAAHPLQLMTTSLGEKLMAVRVLVSASVGCTTCWILSGRLEGWRGIGVGCGGGQGGLGAAIRWETTLKGLGVRGGAASSRCFLYV